MSCGNDVNFNVKLIFKLVFVLLITNSIGFKWKLQILSLEGTQVGQISKQWSGLTREFFTTADYFGISFPVDLDVRMKAVMLGAVMLIVSYDMVLAI